MSSASYRGPERPVNNGYGRSARIIIASLVVTLGGGYILMRDVGGFTHSIPEPVPPIGLTTEPETAIGALPVNPFVVVHTPEGTKEYVGDLVVFEPGRIPGFDDIVTAQQLLDVQMELNDLLLTTGTGSTSVNVQNDLIMFELNTFDVNQSDIPFPAEALETFMETVDPDSLLGKFLSSGRIVFSGPTVSEFTARNLLTNFEPNHAEQVMQVLQQRYPLAGLETLNIWMPPSPVTVTDDDGNDYTFNVERPTSETVRSVRDTIIAATGSQSINYKSVPRFMSNDATLLALDAAQENLLSQLLVQLGQSGFAPYTDKVAIRTSLGGLTFDPSSYDYDFVIHLHDEISPEDLTRLINAQDHFSFFRPGEFTIHRLHLITVYKNHLAGSGVEQIFRPNTLRMFALMDKLQ